MKVLGFNNKEYNLRLVKKDNKRSGLHQLAFEILHELYPLERIYEEVPVPSTRLYIDIFIPSKRLAIEIHGEQHYTFNTFFFQDKLSFYKAQKNDRIKKEWCNLNKIDLVELPFNDKPNWKSRIIHREGLA